MSSTPDTALEAALVDLVATPRLLVALDFDGTLSELVDDPMTARMTPAARRAVDALLAAPATTVAFVSGRSMHDLRIIAEHDDASPILLAGSHGAEFWVPGAGLDAGEDDPASRVLRDELRAEAERAIADIPGAWVEPKTFGFGVHTRTVDPARADEVRARADRIMTARAPLWRRRTGYGITEYAYRAEGKDAAVAHLRAIVDATAALFAGDDSTDEDALASLGPDDLGIRVGPGRTAARMRVADMSGLADALLRLAVLRSSRE